MTLPSSPALLAKKHAFSVRHYLAFHGLGPNARQEQRGFGDVRIKGVFAI
jgi:hypothetical protein